MMHMGNFLVGSLKSKDLFNKEYEHLVRLPKKKGGCFGGKKKIHAGLYVAADGTPL